MRLLVLFCFIAVRASLADQACPTLVGLLATDFEATTPLSQSARTEVRRCNEKTDGELNIALWRHKDKRPALVLDTGDFGVVQLFGKENIVLIETSGGNRDQVFVFKYEKGMPKLIVHAVTKGNAELTSAGHKLHIVIPDIYAGDGPPRSQVYSFSTDLADLAAFVFSGIGQLAH